MSGEPTTQELLEQLAEFEVEPSTNRPHEPLLDDQLVRWDGGCETVGDNWARTHDGQWSITKAGEFALLAWRAQPPKNLPPASIDHHPTSTPPT